MGLETGRKKERDNFTQGIIEDFIPDNLLLASALTNVDRRLFLPLRAKEKAYQDVVIQLGGGASVSQPSLVANMIDLLGLTGKGRVLDIGTASGYTAALLSHLAEQVYSIEYNPSLAERAARRLGRLRYRNVSVLSGDGLLGWPEQAPFEAILISAATRKIPPGLFGQLAEGGRMVLPVGQDPDNVQITIATKYKGLPLSYPVFPAHFHPLRSELEGGWTYESLRRLHQIKQQIFKGSLQQSGKSIEQFMLEMVQANGNSDGEFTVDDYIQGMKVSDEILILYGQLLDQEETTQETNFD